MKELDPDDELTAWYEVQAAGAHKRWLEEQERHRCPLDMPPCPECQAREEEEDSLEYDS